ncbi:hypothetical protein HC251_10340 [Iamia sp. SCSIO 61187]|uniref:hypothetical protein n=1 Tax=Iamia sp. SCSIO 61187 TaxID=2722752 RepID=UPI001C63A2C8|nr:hypothetical protein [Iamia sp. SCSIO 61187]QYG92788.1 hypothetical protein HC251_10340 [Iamia sp. SCSIO 61187]
MRVRTRLFTAAAVGGALLAPLVPVGSVPAGAVSTPALDHARAWLVDQQQDDGGFETVGFPGFETPDAVHALAAAGQADATWSTDEALAAVEVVQTGDGKDPLDAVDDWVDSVQGDAGASPAAKASQAAKVIVLVTAPLGLDETDFDPSDDTDDPVDLVGALVAASGTGSYPDLLFGGKVYAAWALSALGAGIPDGLLDAIASAQQHDGGFAFEGDPAGVILDPDLTAAVVLALREETSPAARAVSRRAIVGLALAQRPSGAWAGAFDDGNANSTAMAMLAAASQGADPDTPCWRDQPLGQTPTSLVGVPYPSPVAAVEADQDPTAGYIRGPFDGPGDPNTFATSQAIQGLAAAEGAAFYGSGVPCVAPVATPNRRLVNLMYADLLRRPAEEAGAVYWTGQFDAGTSPSYLSRAFTGTVEFSRVVLTGLTVEHLGRVPTATEVQDLAPVVRAGRRFDVAATLLGGSEFYAAAGGSRPAWVQAVVPATLGRPALSSDVAYVNSLLDAGRTRAQVARTLISTQDGRSHFVRTTYLTLLRRAADAGGLEFWTAELRTSSPEWLVRRMINTTEYRGLSAPPA